MPLPHRPAPSLPKGIYSGHPWSLRGTDTPDFLNVSFGQKLPVELRPREAGHPRLLGQARGV